jgi:hypothetical protein
MNSIWAEQNPMGPGSLKGKNFLSAGALIGVNTVGQSLRNANLQIRSEPPNPQVPVSIFNQSTISPDISHRPLEVGANFISRTAVAALALLEKLRDEHGHPIPLAWNPAELERVSAIEVYPAATRLAHGSEGRGGSLEGLEQALDLTALGGRLPASADAVDALVCVIAAADFLRGRALGPGPADWLSAQQEGWIWTAEPLVPS